MACPWLHGLFQIWACLQPASQPASQQASTAIIALHVTSDHQLPLLLQAQATASAYAEALSACSSGGEPDMQQPVAVQPQVV